jgi:pyruvate/2-oxoglutarate dehydrogenase complex dihydrolipoamide dehydrogenase (E3) component
MEAAMIAARRGFRVMLYEKGHAAGGQLRLAAIAPRKAKIQWLIDSMLRRCTQAGVTFVYGKAPTVEELAAQKPYAILDATGGKPAIPESIQGAKDNPIVCTPMEILTKQLDIREESVVIVGSGMTGLETAELLCERERNNAVVVMEAASRIAPGALGSNRNVVTAVLDINNVVFMLDRCLSRIGEDRIWFCDSKTGEEYVYPCDRVVLALGTTAENPYGDSLKTVCDRVARIGDAQQSGNIWRAVHDGYEAAIKL